MSIMDTGELLLSSGQAARLLGVSQDTVLRRCHAGTLRGSRLPSGHWRIRLADLRDERTEATASPVR